MIELRKSGMRLSREQLQAARVFVGDMEIDEFDGRFNSAHRTLKRVNVYEKGSSHKRGLFVPLFEPVILRMTERWMVLGGWQIESRGSTDNLETVHYYQEWLVRHVTPELEALATQQANDELDEYRKQNGVVNRLGGG